MKSKLIFIFGLFAYVSISFYLSINTGLSHDELHEELNWAKNFEAIKSIFGLGDYNLLLDYKDKYHGVGFHYISQPIQYLTHNYIAHLAKSSSFGAYLLSKHIVIFFLFFMSGITLYFISLEISKSRSFSIISLILYLSYPYIYGHALINPKDIPFLSFWLFSTFFIIKILKSLFYNNKIFLLDTLILSFLTAYLISIRVVGLLIFFQFLIGLIIVFNYKNFKVLKILKENIKIFALYIISFFIFLYVLNPILWLNPYEVINSINYMAKYYHDICTLTLGECMESQDLPDKYYFIWIFYKLPIISIFGIILFFFIEKKILNQEFSTIIFLNLSISVLVILFLLILFKVAIYDEIRHILFILPLILILSFYNFFIFNKNIFYVFGLITFLFFVLDSFKIYPYQYTWLNSFAKIHNIQKNFEIDYWGVSNKNLQMKIINFAEKSKINRNICIYGDVYTDVFLSINGFDCFKTYSQLDAAKERPFIAYQNVRNLKRNSPNNCNLVHEEGYRYFFSKQKLITGKVWFCS